MAHWVEKYVGRKYVPGQFDCASLIQLVLQERFNVELPLPRCAVSVHTQVKHLDALRDDLAPEVSEPREGDLVLMRCGGRLSHCGMLVLVNGHRHVLHAMRNAGQVVLHHIDALSRVNCKVISFHRARGME